AQEGTVLPALVRSAKHAHGGLGCRRRGRGPGGQPDAQEQEERQSGPGRSGHGFASPWAAAGDAASGGSSLLPMIVRFMPICTVTGLPLTSIVALSLTFQPREPVENSLTTAWNVLSLTVIVSGLACSRNSARLMGHDDFLAIPVLPARKRSATR